ncbi:MAG: DUF6445 family protein [Pseudomonadota bacterium]
MGPVAANPELTIEVTRLGKSGEPVIVIDNFLTDPDAIVSAAAHASDWRDLPPGGYPGRRAALPRTYVQTLLRRMDGPIRRQLLSEQTKLDRFDCSFSMVTRAPDELTALQRVPHIDIARGTRVAVLHYLCGSGFGGTAFFRQDRTGFEQIGPAERERYLAERAEGLRRLETSHQYPDADTPGYERTGFVEARFNRVVAYRSFSLHSGIIENPEVLSADPAQGRLTANFFVDYAPADPT